VHGVLEVSAEEVAAPMKLSPVLAAHLQGGIQLLDVWLLLL
jgi:hypothetical protein